MTDPSATTIDVLVVGAGFGADFLSLYLSHPHVGRVGLCDPAQKATSELSRRYGLDAHYFDLDEALASGQWDGVHLMSPVRFHVDQTLRVLASGRSCACAVPMAPTFDGVQRVVEAATTSRGTYMMMETSLYQREFFHAQDLLAKGELGTLTFLRGAHIQDLDGYPPYWMGFPPMLYATHIVSPLLVLAGAHTTSVRCLGSGRHLPQHAGNNANPHPVECALLELDQDRLLAEVTVAFFETARSFYEGFSVYGTMGAMEWPQVEFEAPYTYRAGAPDGSQRGRRITLARPEPRDRVDALPESLRPFVRPTTFVPRRDLPPIEDPAGHGGSHPYLVNEFVSAVLDGRRSAVDEFQAARFTLPGIVAHQSAMAGGRELPVPRLD